MIAMDGKYFDVLPAGSTQHPSIVFLRNPATGNSRGSFSELNETLRSDPSGQPVMASFDAGQWTIHGTLFRRKLQYLIAEIRPAFTPISQRVLAEKLYQMADESSVSVTATRLMTIKGILNAWRKGQAAHVEKFNDPLSMLNGVRPVRQSGSYQSISISYESSLESFFRLDFQVDDIVDASLLRRLGTATMTAPELAELLTRQLSRAGYELLPDGHLIHQTSTLIFRRPGLDQLYMLSVRQTHSSQILRIAEPLSAAFPMSNRWIDTFLARFAGSDIAAEITTARTQGKLVRLIGGTNANRASGRGTQLFVVRVADDS